MENKIPVEDDVYEVKHRPSIEVSDKLEIFDSVYFGSFSNGLAVFVFYVYI